MDSFGKTWSISWLYMYEISSLCLNRCNHTRMVDKSFPYEFN